MNVISRELVENYLRALQADEAEIESAAGEFQRARARVDVTLLRYTALRDFLTTTLGCSPYARNIEWPDDGRDPTMRGRYRYTGMKVGDAVVEVLKSQPQSDLARTLLRMASNHPLDAMSLDEIMEALSEGGLGFPEPVSARVVNAALMRTTGVERYVTDSGEALYGLAPTDSESNTASNEGDDLPFE